MADQHSGALRAELLDKLPGIEERLRAVEIRGGIATVILAPPGGSGGEDEQAIRLGVEEALMALEGVTRVRVIVESERKPAPQKSRPVQASGKPPARLIIAVASGKGGVGKSTVAANLAGACVKQGLRTGLVDADVFGPSAPRLFGLTDAPGLRKTDSGIEPLRAHGVKLVSTGFLVGDREPVVWRGPMVTGAIRQFLTEVDWDGGDGPLDVLLIDMPPGTGDAQLAIAQGIPISGAVIVSTPQTVALDDARKAMALFERTEIPVLGMIENMSFFLCPHCGEGSEIFGRGGARAEAELMGIPFLGEIPLHPSLREASDAGRLVALEDGPLARAFAGAAVAMLRTAETANRPAPEIVFED
ncbi:MAG: ATP-binding protein involved in chromosome partitioning [Oceanicaulis sp. HLUCCA04]|nr:MAG: ATP-binding protein involved in chromosome partitioning [Oceanicaulis sp. HLUCCA04]